MTLRSQLLICLSVGMIILSSVIVGTVIKEVSENFRHQTKERFDLAANIVNQRIHQYLSDLKIGLNVAGDDLSINQDVLGALAISPKPRRGIFYPAIFKYYDFSKKYNVSHLSIHYKNLSSNLTQIFASIDKKSDKVYSYSTNPKSVGSKVISIVRDEFGLITREGTDFYTPAALFPTEAIDPKISFFFDKEKNIFFDLSENIINHHIGRNKSNPESGGGIVYRGLVYGYIRMFVPISFSFLNNLENTIGADLTIFDKQGNYLAGKIKKNIPTINGEKNKLFEVEFGGETYISLLAKFSSVVAPEGYISISLNEETLQRQLVSFLSKIIFFIAIACLFVLVITFLLLNLWVTRPIHDITSTVKNISDGQLDIKLETKLKNEIGALGRSINTMSNKLYKAFATIEEQNLNLENKVQERTIQLSNKTNKLTSIFDNLEMGICIINDKFVIKGQYSKYLTVLFERPILDNESIINLIFDSSRCSADEVEMTTAALSTIIGERKVSFHLNEHLLIKECTKTIADHTKFIRIDWTPIIENEHTAAIMVILKDVTKIRELEEQTEKSRKKIKIISQLLNVKEEFFNNFSVDMKKTINSIFKIIQDLDSQEDINTILRHLHTIKGNSRTFGFNEISGEVHNIEEILCPYRKNVGNFKQHLLNTNNLEKLEEIINLYDDIFRNELGKGIQTRDEFSITLNQSILEKSYDYICKHSTNTSSSEQMVLKNLISSIIHENIESLLSNCLKSIEKTAKDLSKPPPKVNIEDCGAKFLKGKSNALINSIIHILNNILDHGIESPDERVKKSKPAYGNIYISSKINNKLIDIEIRDDGAGLDLLKIKSKAEELKIIGNEHLEDDKKLAELIFYPNFSTSKQVSQISGRGVGMFAAKKLIEECGGSIQIKLDSPKNSNSKVTFSVLILWPQV